jgi:hypothetical protein
VKILRVKVLKSVPSVVILDKPFSHTLFFFLLRNQSLKKFSLAQLYKMITSHSGIYTFILNLVTLAVSTSLFWLFDNPPFGHNRSQAAGPPDSPGLVVLFITSSYLLQL